LITMVFFYALLQP